MQDKIWALVQKYNALSHEYSNIADDLTRLEQSLEEKGGTYEN